MDESKCFYIASCVFTRHYPDLSIHIQQYLKEHFHINVIRCCALSYKIKEYEALIPEPACDEWRNTLHSRRFKLGETVVSICHNCTAIIEEQQPEINLMSLWELILQDEHFPYPNYHGEKMTLQDCWRTRGHHDEQQAVRELLKRMNIDYIELEDNRDDTTFCGVSLFRPAPRRNIVKAPKRFVENAKGMFEPHTEEQQRALMQEYCNRFVTDKVVTYCHYCSEGIILGGKTEEHLASLLFGGNYHYQ
jgi:hypothetical protein